jgi:ABC-type sugar transport system substrate-binding protein
LKKKMKKLVLFFLAGAMVFNGTILFAAEKYTIGITIYSYNHKYTLRVLAGAEVAARKYNVDIIAIDSQDDQAKQIADTETLIARHVDAIIATPITTEGGQEVVSLANRANIPIVCVSRTVPSGDYTYIGSDDVDAGRMAVSFFTERLGGRGKVAMVMGTMGSSSEIDRSKGWHEELRKYPGMKVVKELTGKFFRDGGLQATEDILTANPDVDAIWYQNDDMLLGGLIALQDARKIGKVLTIGVDGDPEAIHAIKRGQATGTLYQEAELQGGLAVGLAVAHIQGRSLLGYETKFSVITKDNVRQVFPTSDNLIKYFPY